MQAQCFGGILASGALKIPSAIGKTQYAAQSSLPHRMILMTARHAPEDRLVALESLVTHLERDLGTLNSVLLEQRQEIESLKRLISRLDERVTRLAEEEEPRDPAEERPPHY
jgi:SlyX protein